MSRGSRVSRGRQGAVPWRQVDGESGSWPCSTLAGLGRGREREGAAIGGQGTNGLKETDQQ